MFDFGFSELVVIAVVMLIVVGPERLPKVARTAGHILGRLQRYVSDVKSDIQREMQLEDLKKLQQQVEQQARELESSVRGQMAKVEAEVDATAAEVKADLSGLQRPAPVTEASPSTPIAAATDVSSGRDEVPAGSASPRLPPAEAQQQTVAPGPHEAQQPGEERDGQLSLHLGPSVNSSPAEKA
ncbi:MAG: Sec-independent protein translocase protein TatB [Aromatoleum sp.]|jgi:sec-independent protein translocase protein TatB|uniref:Sec-independent protein translocase protein TatB n=1 Tax=Aromatoleum sp. TaxID=2307007 RepID=UPI00289389E1|nr:Sec-independent protein translocase protein TatB [Aromatoleum sp.]MDT3670823.1 Sec-independent protein translocase protein TatB [Aromatoleum sp.]